MNSDPLLQERREPPVAGRAVIALSLARRIGNRILHELTWRIAADNIFLCPFQLHRFDNKPSRCQLCGSRQQFHARYRGGAPPEGATPLFEASRRFDQQPSTGRVSNATGQPGTAPTNESGDQPELGRDSS